MTDEQPERSTGEIVCLGLRGQCPHCGFGSIFSRYLTLADACPNCGLKLSGSDVGDGPVAPAILLIGGLIVGLAAVVELTWQPPLWLHALIWLPLASILVAFILPPIKGLALALQYHFRSTEEETPPGGQ